MLADVNGRAFGFDFVIAGTGYSSDPAQRPELAAIAPLIALARPLYAAGRGA